MIFFRNRVLLLLFCFLNSSFIFAFESPSSFCGSKIGVSKVSFCYNQTLGRFFDIDEIDVRFCSLREKSLQCKVQFNGQFASLQETYKISCPEGTTAYCTEGDNCSGEGCDTPNCFCQKGNGNAGTIELFGIYGPL